MIADDRLSGPGLLPRFINVACSDTVYVYTDPESLPSFAEECNFGDWVHHEKGHG